ncbi:MATE family efflux transporter [Mediterraneibacter massiliensis]|uniref:MATE family efflux transporter n=1 Tax=Mediterraneibacter massiliensis TaxID=1720300 RepID=UPI000E4F6A50|nr:MATE family efflux transporter [Mediterraneibacter massiliensis]RGT71740.1 MATE family efflux transporter [Ruminococcus sp. AF18-22]
MSKNINLLEGDILPSLTKLAFPIMATSLVQMAYNMTDMIWIGRISSNAVAAVGAAGMYMWFANGIATLSRIGGQIKVGHSIGEGRLSLAACYAKNALQLTAFLGVLYGIFSILFQRALIGFFRLNSPAVIKNAEIYLMITCGLVLFSFLNQAFTGIFTALGNSKTSFLATAAGLVMNIVLDPVLIFGIGPFPEMGVAGAAIATVLAQMIVTAMFLLSCLKDNSLFPHVQILKRPDLPIIRELVRLGLPTAVQSMLFSGISMVIARIISGFGDAAIAVQKVGSQIESISWMTSEGFAAAVNSFVAQNHGAKNTSRVRKGYRCAMAVVLLWGVFTTFVLFVFPEPIFRIFITEKELLPMGVDYLKILAVSQLFMCMEITTAGAFNGLGRTVPPAVEGILLTAARIPLALLLIMTPLGLNGIWWAITISSILKGVVLFTWFLLYMKKHLSRNSQ